MSNDSNQFTTLKNAPIENAIVAVKINPLGDVSIIEKINATLFKEYPDQDKFTEQAINFHVNAAQPEKTSINQCQQHTGFILRSEDKAKEVNLLLGDVVLSTSHKYKDWEHLIGTYKTIWQAYEQVNKPDKLLRVGLRYINRFKMTPNEVSTVLGIKPVISTTTPTLLQGVMGRYALQSEVFKSSAIVAVVVEPIEKDLLQVILDIDAFDTDIEYHDFESLTGTLERLRMLKNHLFFDNIPDAKERFQ